MSNSGLVFDLYNPKRRKELLDQVILFVIEGRTPQVRYPHCAAQRLFPGGVARVLHTLGDHFRRNVERNFLPFAAVRSPVEDMLYPMRTGYQLKGSGPFRAEASM
jgi:hypothetical protein